MCHTSHRVVSRQLEEVKATHRFNFLYQRQALALGDVELQLVELRGHSLYQLTTQLPASKDDKELFHSCACVSTAT